MKAAANSMNKSIRKCCICGQPTFSPKSNHCFYCYVMINRMYAENLPPKCIKEICEHVHRHGHVCYYTKFPLNMTDPKDPFYFVFDHMIPGDNKKIVLTFALLNEMKSEMTLNEFKYYVGQFANFIRTGAKIKKRKLSRWFRLGTPKLRRLS